MTSYFAKRYSALKYPLESGTAPGFRPAQLAAAHAVSGHHFSRKEPGIVVMPTGSGKTCVMLLAAFLMRVERVLVLTPSRMVRDQIAEAFKTLRLLRDIGAIDKKVKPPKVAVLSRRMKKAVDWEKLRKKSVVASTVQSASPLLTGVAPPPADLFDLVICDEAHHTPAPSWRAVLDALPEARHLLFTATPFRRDAKVLRGRLVFEYSLARARQDGVFGQLSYAPIQPGPGVEPDRALAVAAEAQLAKDRAAGHAHLLMVRTSTKKRAVELEQVYKGHTKLRLLTVLGSHSQKRVKATLDSLRSGAVDGVICVDMLGEGFDLPRLKVAALHSPHRSLAVTLQFIGRFARTTAANVGSATFLAVPSEIEDEAAHLYAVGAEWNELVEAASRLRIDAERATREVLATFVPAKFAGTKGEVLSTENDEVDLSAIAPYFHVKVLEARKGVDLTRPLALPPKVEPYLVMRSDDHNALVYVTREVSQCRWSKDDRLSNVCFELFVLFFDEKSKLLFICSSIREASVYDALVESVALGETSRLSPLELNRVLRGVAKPMFFSVGMRNRSGFGSSESYKMISGRAADRAIQKSDGRFYDRGHCFGGGEESGAQMTIGFSSASKIWSNKKGMLPDFFKWCTGLASKLSDASTFETHSNIDHLPLAQRITQFPEPVVFADWNAELFRRGTDRLRFPGRKGQSVEHPLVEFSLTVGARSSAQIDFSIEGHGQSIPCSFRLDRKTWFATDAKGEQVTCGDAELNSEIALLDLLHQYPPSFFTASLARIEGSTVSGALVAVGDVFDVGNIEVVDWHSHGVDPLLEKPKKGKTKRSLFEWLQARLVASTATAVFNDDGSGEAADFVALTNVAPGRTQVSMYHCKAAAKKPVPGRRVEDLYEVVGQAVKCVRLTQADALGRHLQRRMKTTKEGKARLVKGTEADLAALLGPTVVVEFQVFVVQPGVGATPPKDIANLLAATNSYLVGAQAGSLRVIGT